MRDRKCTHISESVCQEMQQLEQQFARLFVRQPLHDEVVGLKGVITDYRNGSLEAEDYLCEYGQDVVDDIKQQLQYYI